MQDLRYRITRDKEDGIYLFRLIDTETNGVLREMATACPFAPGWMREMQSRLNSSYHLSEIYL